MTRADGPKNLVHRSYRLAIASSVAVVVGAIGPWTRLGIRIDGPQDAVVLALGCIAFFILFLAGTDRRWIAAAPLVIGLTVAGIVANDIRDPSDVTPGAGRITSLQWGIYLALVGAATLVLASVLLLVANTQRRARNASLQEQEQRRSLESSGLAEYVQSFCLLVGYRRNGLSLLGSLLNAHPDMVIAPDQDVMGLAVASGVEREELVHRLVRRAKAHYKMERKRGHPYVVEGGWQEHYQRLRVVGAKCGDATMRRIRRNQSDLDLMEKNVGVPVRIVHVVRNPYDVVAAIAQTTNKAGVQRRTVTEAVSAVAELAEINREIIERRNDRVFTLRYEGLMADPHSTLYALCAFLGVDADHDYLEACASLVLTRPHPTVHSLPWSEEARADVDSVIARYSFFEGYSAPLKPSWTGIKSQVSLALRGYQHHR